MILQGVVPTCNFKDTEDFTTNNGVCYNITKLLVVQIRNFSLQYQNLEQVCEGSSKVLRLITITEGMFYCYKQSDCLL
jgi:hypothetical protein